jgi:hypothetical protein
MREELPGLDDIDLERIDISQDRTIFYWMRALGVPEDELIRTVRRVGPRTEDVRRALALAELGEA